MKKLDKLIYEIKKAIYLLRCKIWRLTETKKTLQFTVFEQTAIEEIVCAVLRDLDLDVKSQENIRKLLKKVQKKFTKLTYYECQSLTNILAWAMFESKSSFNCDCIREKITLTPYD